MGRVAMLGGRKGMIKVCTFFILYLLSFFFFLIFFSPGSGCGYLQKPNEKFGFLTPYYIFFPNTREVYSYTHTNQHTTHYTLIPFLFFLFPRVLLLVVN